MNLKEALERLSVGDYKLTLHAKLRMSERNISDSDIRCCGQTGIATLQEDGKIKVKGQDIDKDSLTIICVKEDEFLIITLY